MWFWKYLKKYKFLLFISLLLGIVNTVFSLLDPQIIRLLVDNYAMKADQFSSQEFLIGVGILLLAFVGVALISRTAKNFQDYVVNVITQKIGTEMYSSSIQHSLSLPYDVFEDQRSGELLQKIQKAKIDIQLMINSFINGAFLSIVGFLFVLIYAFIVHWSIGLVFLIIAPSIGTIMFLLSKKIKESQKSIIIESSELAGSTTETIRNIELVKSLGLEKQEIERLNKTNDKILNLELKKIKLIRTMSFIQGTLVNGCRAMILFLMLWLLFKGQISLGEFLSLFFYTFFIFNPLGELANMTTQYQESKTSSNELGKILNLEIEKKPQNPIKIEKVDEINFKNVEFSYNSNKDNSVEKINLNINKGETVAFVGLSGSGKTTLIKLILGLYKPNKGKLTFNQIESEKIDYDSLRKKIGFVSQETQLFAGTIKENLTFVNPSATDKECLEALKLASSMGIVDRGNKGLDTKIGEGGIKLSGGERQRLAIARALLRNPEILIFDEATSNLDSLNEKEITKTIKNISKVKPQLITILVAHRLSTIAHSDKIYVLNQGKIIEEGNHSKLIRKKGIYFDLWKEQSRKSI